MYTAMTKRRRSYHLNINGKYYIIENNIYNPGYCDICKKTVDTYNYCIICIISIESIERNKDYSKIHYDCLTGTIKEKILKWQMLKLLDK